MASEWDEEPYDWKLFRSGSLLLYQMATKVIGEKIKVDPLAADSAIRYCLSRVAGDPYNSARQNILELR